MTAPRGIRNNNPGNIRKSGVPWVGKIDGADAEFETFDTPENGIRALAANLLAYQDQHGIRTIRQAINRWAPPVENNTDAYIASVVASVGIGADAAADFHDPRLLAALAVAIIKVENGTQPYPAAVVESAVNAALGITGEQPAAPIEEASHEAAPAAKEKQMGPLALLSMFGPLITGMIPQVKNIVQPPPESNAARNLELAQLLINTIITAAGTAAAPPPAVAAPSAESQQMAQLAAAVTAMQNDLDLQKKVREAVITEPRIMDTLQVVEFGGGVEKAAERGLAIQQAERPFWYNPVVWVTAALIPMMYLIVAQILFTLAGPYMVSNGVEGDPLVAMPWYAVIGFDSNTRTGLINLIVGFVFGGICGIWFGTTVAKQRSDAATNHNSDTSSTR